MYALITSSLWDILTSPCNPSVRTRPRPVHYRTSLSIFVNRSHLGRSSNAPLVLSLALLSASRPSEEPLQGGLQSKVQSMVVLRAVPSIFLKPVINLLSRNKCERRLTGNFGQKGVMDMLQIKTGHALHPSKFMEETLNEAPIGCWVKMKGKPPPMAWSY
jgi:hypothetical protein